VSTVPLRVLGGLRLEGSTGSLSVGGRIAERLLGLLVVAGGRPIEHDAIVDVLWPDWRLAGAEPPLRMAVSRLRSRLAQAGLPNSVRGANRSYRLCVPAEQVDVTRFVALTDEARRCGASTPDRAAALFDGALALWRGDPFGALGVEVWAVPFVTRLTELRMAVEEDFFDLELRRRREGLIVDRLRFATESQPFRERRWEQLALALYRLGGQTEALRTVERAQSFLREEVGLEIGEGLRDLERAFLEQDPSLSPSPAGDHNSARSRDALVGRDGDIESVRRLMAANRVVTVHGLAGVGKSTLARVVVADHKGEVVFADLGGVSTPEAVWLAVGSAVGFAGAEDPAELPAAIVGQLRSHPRLVVLDGAEASAPTAAEVVETLVLLVPTVTFLVTSRIPLAVTGEVRYFLDVLDDCPDGRGPAARLFLDRAGITFDQLDEEGRRAVERICQRTGGLPLALELAAASADRHGLQGLATMTREKGGAGALGDAVRWSMEILPADSARLLLRATLLPGGVSFGSAARLAGREEDQVRQVLAPLLQSRLLTASEAGPGGLRYRMPEPVQDVILKQLAPPEAEVTQFLIVDHLTAVGAAVGDVECAPCLAAVPAAEAELANVRHWLRLRAGEPDCLSLAVAMARTMSDLGLGPEARRWLDAELGASVAIDSLLVAKATAAAVTVAGFFAASALDAGRLERAAIIAETHESWQLWLFIQGHLAIAQGWCGDQSGAFALLHDPVATARLAELDDPWMDVNRRRLLALVVAVTGDYAAARHGLDGLPERFEALGDTGAALQTLFVRAWLARGAEDMDWAADDLMRARELAPAGSARGTQALVNAELAHLARGRGEPAATALLAAAVNDLERAGNLRSAAAQRRDLGGWRLADGDRNRGLDDLRAALPMLLLTDRRGAAAALAELVVAIAPLRPVEGRLLVTAAHRMILDGSGPAVPAQHLRVREVAAALDPVQGSVTGSDQLGDEHLSDEELIALAFGSATLD